jgi:hypothetical protein
MRIPLDELDKILANPDAYCEEEVKLSEGKKKKYVRPGRNAYMKYALQKWHSGALSEEDARAEVIQRCERFQGKSDTKRMLKKLNQYIEDSKNIDAKTRLSLFDIRVPLPKGADPRFKITGQVRRLDRNTDGTFTAWLYSEEYEDWNKGIRIPLIQDAIALKFNFDLDEIWINIYCFADCSSHIYRFTQAQVDIAKDKLNQLLSKLLPLAEREPPSPQIGMEFDSNDG